MIGTALGKLATLGVAAKIGVATGAVALAGTAFAATGQLPAFAQERVADVVANVGVSLPGARSPEPPESTGGRSGGDTTSEDTTKSDVEQCGENEGEDVPAGPVASATCVEDETNDAATSTTEVQGNSGEGGDGENKQVGNDVEVGGNKSDGDHTSASTTTGPGGS
jgi:hypothetical protein